MKAFSVRASTSLLLTLLSVILAASPALAQTVTGRGDTRIVQDEKTGHVGIGTDKPAVALDVPKGEARIGNSGAPCEPIHEGAIRYLHPNLQFCDGTHWRILLSKDVAP